MKIELNENQYRMLVKSLVAGNYLIITSDFENENDEEYKNLENHILSYAKDFGMGKEVTFNQKENVYDFSDELDQDLSDIIDKYNFYKFWEDLLNQLVERDLGEKYKEKLESLSEDQRQKEGESIYNFYQEEFIKNGITNLRLKK